MNGKVTYLMAKDLQTDQMAHLTMGISSKVFVMATAFIPNLMVLATKELGTKIRCTGSVVAAGHMVNENTLVGTNITRCTGSVSLHTQMDARLKVTGIKVSVKATQSSEMKMAMNTKDTGNKESIKTGTKSRFQGV